MHLFLKRHVNAVNTKENMKAHCLWYNLCTIEDRVMVELISFVSTAWTCISLSSIEHLKYQCCSCIIEDMTELHLNYIWM